METPHKGSQSFDRVKELMNRMSPDDKQKLSDPCGMVSIVMSA